MHKCGKGFNTSKCFKYH